MIHCDVLLYEGRWTPHGNNNLKDTVCHALYEMVRYYGWMRIMSVTFERAGPFDNGLYCVVHITGEARCASDVFCDRVWEAMLYHLDPEYASQLEVELISA